VTFWLSSRSDVPGARYFWDKLLHTVGFAGLGVLALRAFHGGFERPRLSLTLYAGLTVILWGISDEFHQSFVPGRDATPWDVVADAVGFAVGVVVFAILTSRATRAVQPR
jgi:VanZ family protein